MSHYEFDSAHDSWVLIADTRGPVPGDIIGPNDGWGFMYWTPDGRNYRRVKVAFVVSVVRELDPRSFPAERCSAFCITEDYAGEGELYKDV